MRFQTKVLSLYDLCVGGILNPSSIIPSRAEVNKKQLDVCNSSNDNYKLIVGDNESHNIHVGLNEELPKIFLIHLLFKTLIILELLTDIVIFLVSYLKQYSAHLINN